MKELETAIFVMPEMSGCVPSLFREGDGGGGAGKVDDEDVCFQAEVPPQHKLAAEWDCIVLD